MKYTKTYDNFITNLFTKKKLPNEVIQLGRRLMKIVEYYIIDIIEKDWTVEIIKKDNRLSIYIEPNDIVGEAKIIELYYNYTEKRVMYVFTEIMKDLQFFLENIIRKFCESITEFRMFFIKLEDIQNVIDELTVENLELFMSIKKFNI